SSRNASSSSSPLILKGSSDHIHGRTESLSSEDTVTSREAPALLRDSYSFHSASSTLGPSSRRELSFHRSSSGSYDLPQRSPAAPPSAGRQRPASPGSEMVTLEEFLEESNRLSPPSDPSCSRDDLLSGYCRKPNEPSATGNLLVPSSRKEAVRVPASHLCAAAKAAPASEEGSVPKAGSGCGKPGLSEGERERPAGPQAAAAARQAAQPQQAFSLSPPPAAAELRGARDGGGPVSRLPVPAGAAVALRERPRSANVAGPAVPAEPRCRQLDARRLSLAPPKDERPLSFHQFSVSPAASTCSLNAQQQERGSAGQHYSSAPHTPAKVRPRSALRSGEAAALSPARAGPSSAEGSPSPGQGQGDAQHGRAPGKLPEGAAGPVEEPLRGGSSSASAAEPQGEQQTVWYEYGCV
uniref:Uncharacterized protein n=1 Tax=Nothoprocta perdicaria TaxID=30464 RepID=A0A8C6YZV2_NOTPE